MSQNSKYTPPQKWVLSKRQIQILKHVRDNGTVILERAYKDLGIKKPTAGYHIKQLENQGFIEAVEEKGRVRPIKVTELGEATLRLLNDDALSDGSRLKISAFDLVRALGLKMLSKDELSQVVQLFQEELEREGDLQRNKASSIV